MLRAEKQTHSNYSILNNAGESIGNCVQCSKGTWTLVITNVINDSDMSLSRLFDRHRIATSAESY